MGERLTPTQAREAAEMLRDIAKKYGDVNDYGRLNYAAFIGERLLLGGRGEKFAAALESYADSCEQQEGEKHDN